MLSRHLTTLIIDVRPPSGEPIDRSAPPTKPRVDTDERFDKKNSGSRPCHRHERHLLFTMVSQILGRPTAAGNGAAVRHPWAAHGRARDRADDGPAHRGAGVVEPDGIEPTTSCVQSRRSPS